MPVSLSITVKTLELFPRRRSSACLFVLSRHSRSVTDDTLNRCKAKLVVFLEIKFLGFLGAF